MREFRKLLRERKRDSHKGDYGHVFIIAGSRGMGGAAALCSLATLRAGAGLVTLGIPNSLNLIMEARLMEVMSLPLPETGKGNLSLKAGNEILKMVKKVDVVIIGPGLSQHPETKKLVRDIIVEIRKAMVIDADGLNAVSDGLGVLKRLKAEAIITPHPGEMSRLLNKSKSYVTKNRLSVAKDFSGRYNLCVVLKGAGTVVADKGSRVYINKTGNPGMATAGSGDVLTGIIGGFLAQGLRSFDAARLGVYVHGLAGDLAAKEKGETSLIAGDILKNIPEAIKSLR